MRNFNNDVTLEGGLTRDPEYREDIGLITFSIAIDRSGREGSETTAGYFDIVAWVGTNDYTLPSFSKYLIDAYKNKTLAKGTRVRVAGSLSHERWEKDGVKNSKIVIKADNVQITYSKVLAEQRAAKAAEAGSSGGGEQSYVADAF